MKVFISLPMRDRLREEIDEEKEKILSIIKKEFDNINEIDIINNYFIDCTQVEALGKAISLMSNADLVIFSKEWTSARGCLVENEVCLKYTIPFAFVTPCDTLSDIYCCNFTANKGIYK